MEKTVALSENESININQLNDLLNKYIASVTPIISITRFAGGYSNLTYRLATSNQNFVMRMAPAGANIQSAHDMEREYKVLNTLQPFFNKVPLPILYYSHSDITGTPFYIMEEIEGIILRSYNAPKLNISPNQFEHCAKQLVETLAQIHTIDIETTKLIELGKPAGYVNRQVEGWIKRYFIAETDLIESMNQVAEWLKNNHPKEQSPSLLHNDFKYDNIVFNNDLTKVIAVLDWEMATVGDPLMDLGAMLAYWFEQDEEPIFQQYNCSWLPGNLSRSELIDYYALLTKRDLTDINYYYVFGLFKNAVIAQQIYHRYKNGFSKDERFGALLPLIKLLGKKALNASC